MPVQLPQVVPSSAILYEGDVYVVISQDALSPGLKWQLAILLYRCKGFPGASIWRPGPSRHKCS